eukprot:9543831-Prorocentrum_lima.AAC.1
MTSSLVGSEMCIRDSNVYYPMKLGYASTLLKQQGATLADLTIFLAVSYTHLTLPTICSV